MKVLKYSWVISNLLLFICISRVYGQSSQNVNVVGRWAHGPCQAVCADSSFAFIGNGATFQILDLSEPSTPVVLGETILPEFIENLVISGTHAYVADGSSGMRILDIFNYSTPTEIAFYHPQSFTEDVAVSGNYAYVTAGDSGLRILDISNPSYPSEISSIYPSGNARFVEVFENYAYVSIEWSLRIIDISDPYNPNEIGHVDIWAYDFDIYGHYAYVTDRSYSNIHIIDISNPANPVEINSINTPGWAYEISVLGKYAYLANGNSGLRVFDLSDPTNPQDIASNDTPGEANKVACSGRYVYVADKASGLRIIEAINPVQQGTLSPLYGPQDVTVSETYAYLADHMEGLKVIDISNPSLPSQVGSTVVRGRGFGVVQYNNYAYVASGDTDLTIIDISNPANPTITGWVGASGWAVDVAVVGSYAYVAAQTGGLRIINISDPYNPVTEGFYVISPGVYGVDVAGNYAYVTDGIWMHILDVSNKASPFETGSVITKGDASDIKVQGDHVFIADYMGLSVIDVSNPANPNQIAYLRTTDTFNNIVLDNGYAFLGGGGIVIVDITNPDDPKRIASYESSGYAAGISVQGDYAYLAGMSSSFETVRLHNPVEVGAHETADNARSVTINGTYAYVAEAQSGLMILDISNPSEPEKISSYDTPDYAHEIAVQGNYAYVADNGALRIINIADPFNPQETGSVPVYSSDVAVYGNYAYTIKGYTGVHIIDVSNPASPSEVRVFDTPGYAQDIQISGDYAYIADGTSGLRILNITNPASPFESGYFDTPGNAKGVDVNDQYAYVTDNDALLIIDISNPASPVEKGSLDVDCNEVIVSGDYACISHEYNLDFQIIDVSDPENPQVVGYFDHGYFASGIDIEGANTYLAHGTEGIYIFRETIPADPPINLTAGGSSPSPWQNVPNFILNWDNPGDMSGISQAKYKIGTQPPTSIDDFNGVVPGTAPQTISVTQEGSQSLYVWLVDNAGNEEISNFNTTELRYDASISSPSDISESQGISTNTWQNSVDNPTFSWTAPSDLSGINKYHLYFGSDPGGSIAVDSTNSTSYSFNASEGIFYFRIRAKDNAGNIGDWMTGFIFKYDSTDPTNPVSVSETGGAVSDIWQADVADPNFTWSGATDQLSGIMQYMVYWGIDPTGTPTLSSSLPGFNPDLSPNDIYYLRVYVEDAAGNRSENTTLFIFKHDALPPVNPSEFSDIVGSENNVWQNTVNDPNFAWNPGNDPLSGIQGYKYYWGINPSGTSQNMVYSPGFNPVAVDTGIWYLRISAIDLVGNSSSWFTAYTFKFDDIVPVANAQSNDTSGYVSFNVSWADAYDRGGSGLVSYDVKVRRDAGEWVVWDTNMTTTSAEFTGEHGYTYSFEVAALDHAGNKENFSGLAETYTVIDTLTTDIQPPARPINLTAGNSSPSPWQNTPQFELDWTNPPDENGIAAGYYKLTTVPTSNSDYRGILTGGPPNLVIATAQGGQDLYLWLEDGRGNVNFQNYSLVKLRYDGTRPVHSIAHSPDTTVAETFTVSWSGATDNGGSGLSGRYDVRVREDQGAWFYWLQDSLCSNAEYTGKNGHMYYFESLATDNAGNTEVYTSVAECSTYVAARLTLSLSPIQGEVSDQIEINYDIYNYDSSLTDISGEYSLSTGLPWHPATIIGNALGIQPENYQGTIQWDSYADAPGVDRTSVRFRMTPSDFQGPGVSDSTLTFHLDNNRLATVAIDHIEGEQNGDVVVSYQLYDQEQDTLSVFCEYLTPGSQYWLNASTTGKLTGLTEYNTTVIWNSRDDLPAHSNFCQFRIKPFDNDIGIYDSITIFIDNVGAPDVESMSSFSGEQSGDITINYILSDNEGDNIDLICKYSENSGIDWHLATVSGSVADITPANYVGSLIWKSATDLPGVDKSTVKFQITANDGNSGFPKETEVFHLDNNLPPVVEISPIASLQSGKVYFPVIIQDAERDTIQISGTYQYEGSGWKQITFSGAYEFSANEYVNMLEWPSVNDIGFGAFKSVRVQLVPIDNDSGMVSVSNIFDINNYAADYTSDFKINFADLVIFAKAWYEQDLTKEIGPADGMPPLLIPTPDGKFDFEDLMVLVQQWNWSFDTGDSLAKVNVLSSDNTKKSDLYLNSQINENKFTEYTWEKETDFVDQIIEFTPVNQHLLNLSQSTFDVWSNEFVSGILFSLDSSASILGMQLEIDYDPEVIGFGEVDNYLLCKNNGFIFKNSNSQDGRLTFNTVILEQKENLYKKSDSLLYIHFNPLENVHTVLKYQWKVYGINGRILTQGREKIQLNIHHSIPKQYALHQNYPNPFNSSTTIRYQIPVDSKVKLEIYNVLGERVTTLINTFQKAAYYSHNWNISQSKTGIASGMYFVRLVARGTDQSPFTDQIKILILK